ncbi:MAG: chemotaxis protein CheD [Rhodocyclaceae bacterium]|nr:chemotaxis protein CheD [Rhodocyclaceae bacterium]
MARNPLELERLAQTVPPGGWAVSSERPVATLLGSCVSVCLWDPKLALGGLNHFMLPEYKARPGREMDVLLCGDHAMEVLLNALLAKGARRVRIQAKVFGGGAIVESLAGMPIGDRNAAFASEWLAREGIAVLARDVLGPWSRKVVFDPIDGSAYCRRSRASRRLVEAESQYGQSLVQPATANVELF